MTSTARSGHPARLDLPLCLWFATCAAIGAGLTLTPRVASACGGTFCDNTGQLPMPVDQRGEDILFVQDGPEIEVHVRIQYSGEAEHFAWLVPLQAVPEIAVGSDALFLQLAEATAPRWLRDTAYQCPDEDPDSWDGGGFVPDSDFASASEPDVVALETVGAFEVVVLQGGDAAGISDFLDDNGYQNDPEAGPIIQQYLDEGFLFAAVKLTAASEVEDIHPLVFRMQGDEPCVPLRLTRIAAEDDMGVRAYFLNQSRWAPRNYAHVVLNTLAFPWQAAGNLNTSRALYLDQLSAAVDLGGGRAFATDYAGASEVVSQGGIYESSWDETAFIGVDPITAIQLIANQNFNRHPLIQPLLMQFIPPPDGMDAQDYWNNISQYQDLIDLGAWDSEAFAAALAERIIEPGLHAIDLLDTWPYLTRLHTAISPHEMTVDPIFAAAPDLGDVSNVVTTEALDLCGEAGMRFGVPWLGAERLVCLGENDEWPASLRELPALRIEKVPPMGPAQVVVDFSAQIAAARTSHQELVGCAGPGGDEGGGEGGEDGMDGMDEGSSGGEQGDETGGMGDAGLSGVKAGCACDASDEDQPRGLAFALLGLACLGGALRRRPHGSGQASGQPPREKV